ncbi:Mbeg1-like protein [Phyllobacterium zundukense]|uniref:Fungal lipase-like domain-containing protein n=1 Tax=Phyllobacterium zundukense TaxID=1867719 RepID=A0A2N9VZV4_9HYPH|nr:Mbeg1-like protein [Phyllobacterium zundukense]ATU94499.1 hypothetical protein BLM14_22530 [Phyllobacterium zundukense]PIO45022.1 hypothetical protein B5P45_09455 [Phyllobacterium zundukense]
MTDAKLLRAVLAMDAYNQDDVRAVELGGSPFANQIGTAEVILRNAPNDVGFSAVAYRIGQVIVISYRGNDTDSFGSAWTDAESWLGGAGWEAAQAKAAALFYQDVVSLAGDNIVLTGHSLGGGLAGLMASIHNKNAIVFDSMPYAAAAANVYYNATTPLIDVSNVWLLIRTIFRCREAVEAPYLFC